MPQATPKGARRPRGSIRSEDIVDAAFELARNMPLDQLTMPSLAEHLGIGVTSVYWHFRRKDELLNAMTDRAVEKYLRLMPRVRPERPWQEVLYEHITQARRIFRDDETLADLMLIRTSTYSREATQRVFELIEAVVAHLVRAGFDKEEALRTYHAVSVYMRGMVIHDRLLRTSNAPTLDGRQKRITDWSSMPLLASLLDSHDLAGTRDDDFEFGVSRLLSGFAHHLAARNRAPAAGTVPADAGGSPQTAAPRG